jgi:hypothetical protein
MKGSLPTTRMHRELFDSLGVVAYKIYKNCPRDMRDRMLGLIDGFMNEICAVDVYILQQDLLAGREPGPIYRIGTHMTDEQLETTLALPMSKKILNQLLTGACGGEPSRRLRQITRAGADRCDHCASNLTVHPEFDFVGQMTLILCGLELPKDITMYIALLHHGLLPPAHE